jgi:2-dehydro-3-deoxygluconokinase
MKIACIGEAMIELSFRGSTPSIGVAGDTLNTAIYLKRAAPKLQVDYITRLGSDPFSTQIKTFIAAQNIGIEAIETSQKRHPGLYAISTSPAESAPLPIGARNLRQGSCFKRPMAQSFQP